MEIVRHDSRQLILPKEMSILEAIEWLQMALQEEETDISFTRHYDIVPTDGAFQVFQAIKEVFGFSQVKAAGLFEEPPEYIEIKLVDGSTVEVPWGKMIFPGIEGFLQTTGENHPSGIARFKLVGKFKKKNLPKVTELTEALERRIKAGNSIYRGQSIDARRVEILNMPPLARDRIVLHPEAERRLEAHLWQIIQDPEKFIRHGVQPKRALLLKGPYGTGKSLTALVTANVARQNGMTFILADEPSESFQALELARMYQPSVVFIEDIDRLVGNKEEQTQKMIRFREVVDGVLSKNAQIMLVMTTNFPENIHESFRRTGRIDVVVDFPYPTVEMAKRLLEINLEDVQLEKEALDIGAVACEGLIPSLVTSVADRAKVYSLHRNGRQRKLRVSGDDIVAAAAELHEHQAFINRAEAEDPIEKIHKAVEVVRSSPMGRLFLHKDAANEDDVVDLANRIDGEGVEVRQRTGLEAEETREKVVEVGQALAKRVSNIPDKTCDEAEERGWC